MMMGLGAAGAGLVGMVAAEPAGGPGGRGAGRLGTRAATLTGGELTTGEVRLRGTGGGARGFSKLDWSFRGNRGLCGGLSGGCAEP